jgi:hypothetical protein
MQFSAQNCLANSQLPLMLLLNSKKNAFSMEALTQNYSKMPLNMGVAEPAKPQVSGSPSLPQVFCNEDVMITPKIEATSSNSVSNSGLAQMAQYMNPSAANTMIALGVQNLILQQIALKTVTETCQNLNALSMNAHAKMEMTQSSTSDGSCQSKELTRKVSKTKKIRKHNLCGHPEREHYAKNLCYNCYHRHGRNKKPWNCTHDKLYAQGLCQNCYITQYNKKRTHQKMLGKIIDKKDDTDLTEASSTKIEEGCTIE